MDSNNHPRRENVCPLSLTTVQCQELFDNVKSLHRAVVGDPVYKIKGIVDEIAELKAWRRKLDLRVAAISGGVVVAIWAVKGLVAIIPLLVKRVL